VQTAMTSTLFSVLMPTYGGDDLELFEKALNSVFFSELMPDEVIVAVDGPISKKHEDILSTYSLQYSFMKIVKLPTNQGLAMNLNNGLLHCQHEVVIRCDADDYNTPSRFSKLRAEFDVEVKVDVVSSYILEQSQSSKLANAIKRVPLTHIEIKRYAKYRNPINHMAAAYRKSSIINVGGYPDIPFREDYGLWLKMLSHGHRFKNLDEVLVIADTGDEMLKRRSGIKHVAAELKLLRLRRSISKLSIDDYLIFVMRAIVILTPHSSKRLLYFFTRKIT
jgi:glycosyltransferase involved in cell wall biosynthesis